MPCKIEIEKNLTEKVENLSEEGLGKKLSIANNIANRVNKIFGVKVVEFMQSGDFIDRIIRIPTSLINEYYINELRIEEKEAIERSIKANEYINDEGDVVSRDDYNFYQLDDRGINPLLESSIEKSLQPELVSVRLTPNTFLDTLTKYGFTKEEILYLIEPLTKNPSLWLEAPNVNMLISYRIAEQSKFSQSKTAKKANEELDKEIKDFLKNLNITVEEYEELKDESGLNVLGIANILNKSVELAKNRKIDTLPEEAAHFYVELLAKRNNRDNLTEYNLYQDLMSKIESWEKFEEIKKAYMPVYKNIEMVKKEAIAKAIAEAVVTRFESKNDSLKKAITDFLDWVKSIFKTEKNFNIAALADNVAQRMLSKDYSDIAKDISSSSNLTDYKDVDKDTLDLISKFSKIGAYLTGSISLRKQGTIYRTLDELFHDLDFEVPIENKEKFLKDLKELFPEIQLRSEFDSKNSFITLWKLNYNGKEYDIDFFFSKTEIPITKDNMVHWKDIFQAKLDMGRTKDVTDFINFIPFKEPVQEQKNKFLQFFERFFQLDESAQEIKPGVQELFEYNDSLQTFKDNLIGIIGVDKVKELYAGTDVEFNSFIIDEVELGFDKDLIVTIKTDKGQRTAFNLRLDGFYQQLKISEGGKTVRGIYAPLSEKVTAIDFLINEFKKVSTDKLTGNKEFPSYNKQKEYYLAKDVNSLLQDIVKFTEDNDTKLLAEALLKIPNINNIPLTITKYTKELRGRIKDNPNALGTYSSAFPELITVIGNLPKTTFEVVFLHELIHGVTVNEYYKNEDFSEKINKLYNHALKFKDYKTSKGITLGKMYGMKNPTEFMSEAMTNPDFIYELSKYYSPIQEKLKEKNIFQEFINLVVDLIKNKLEGKGKKYIEDNLGKTVLNTISNYAKISSKGIYSISKFEEKQIKPGVEELFESNPELANAVYEAVGVDISQLKEDVNVTNAFLTARQHEEAKRINSGEFDDIKLDLKVELQNIIDNSINPLLVELAKSIQNKESLKTIKAYSTQKLFKTKEGFEPAAAYQAETQRLVLFLGNTARFENKEREYQYLLHELVHHFVDRELVLTNSKQAENIRQLFKYTKYQLTKAGKENLYGLTNFHEFVTEALTNPDFQKELKNLQVPDQFLTKSFSIFDYFLELISKILGTNKSVLEAVVFQAADIFELQEYKKSLSITPQQKQQATFMFSEFLDVYLQDFEQVEKILKEEKIIDKKCS